MPVRLLAERDRSGDHDVGEGKGVHQQVGVLAHLGAQVVDGRDHRLGSCRREPPVLEEPGAVSFEHRQRVQVAQRVQQIGRFRVLTAVDGGDEELEDDAVDVRPRGGEHVVLHGVEHVERVVSVADPGSW